MSKKQARHWVPVFSMNKFYTMLPRARQAVLTRGSEWGGGGNRYKLPCPDYVACALVIIICRLYKFTFSEQAQVTLQVGVSVSDLV